MRLKILDLFSGLGGFSLGLERTGQFKTVAFCDNDKFSNLVLQKHWKGAKIYNDVKEITKEKLKADGVESPDIITGGFPCQPFSVAGKQKGTSDDRHLWPEMFRIIQEFTPRWVIGENVKGITNIQDGMVFETVCTDLEGEGYEVRAFNIPAAGVGAPHRRERIWIVANSRRSIRGEQSSWNQESIGSRTSEQTEWSTDSDSITGSSEREKIMANSNERNVEAGRERQRGIRQTNQGPGQSSNAPSSSEVMADSDTGLSNGSIKEIQTGRDTSITSSEDVADTKSERLQRSRGQESSRNFYGLEQNTQRNENEIRSESERRSRTPTDVANTERQGLEGLRKQSSSISRQDSGTQFRNESSRGTTEDVANTNLNREKWNQPKDRNGSRTQQNSQDVADTESSFGNDIQAVAGIGGFTTQEVFGDGSSVRGESAWWDFEPDVGRVAHGLPGRVYRLKGLGNSIIPQIAQEIGNAIIAAEGEEKKKGCPHN